MKSHSLKALRALSVFAITMASYASAQAAVTWSAVADFSKNSNPNSTWTYGSQPTLGNGFAPLTFPDSANGLDAWASSINYPGEDAATYIAHNSTNSTVNYTTFSIPVDELQLHPGAVGQYAVVRWTVPFTAPTLVTISGQFSSQDIHVLPAPAGTTTDVHILKSGVALMAGNINGTAAVVPFGFTIQVKPGETIDFAVGYGANYDYHFDSTGLKAQITYDADANPIIKPTISASGVVPVYSSSTTIQPGSWFSIYGTNLAVGNNVWDGTFPTTLGGTSVTVNNKPAYMWFVSPGQINAQAPDDTATGTVTVVVTTVNGSASGTVTLASASPSFLLLGDGKHATGIILTPDNSGSQGGGAYDLLGPASAGAGFRAAKKGENVALYAVGFGPTDHSVPAGKAYSSSAKNVTMPQVTLGGGPLSLDFAGIIGAGLYQLNFKVPASATTGDLPLQAVVNGLQSQASIVIPIQ